MALSTYGGGGAERGFNDASMEFFNSRKMESITREVIQNSLDARKSDTITMHFKHTEINTSDINGNDLKKHMIAARGQYEKGSKEYDFFNKSVEMLSRKTLPVFSIIDEGTTGLDTNEKLAALIYKEGTSHKSESTAGGSFGIGKNAPFNASPLRLVCYTTRYLKRGQGRVEKFIGRCKIVAHEFKKQMRQNDGFGTTGIIQTSLNGRFEPVLGRDNFPKSMWLEKTGTGIHIVGLDATFGNALSQIEKAAANHFFAAIHEKRLRVYINGDTDEVNLKRLSKPYKWYHQMMYTGNKQTCSTRTMKSGKLSFEVQAMFDNDDIYTNRIAYVNKKGMLVTDDKSSKRNPFYSNMGQVSGTTFVVLVQSTDRYTEKTIRSLEPPTHMAIERDRATTPEIRKDLANIKRQIMEFIHESVKVEVESTVLDELSDILPLERSIKTEKYMTRPPRARHITGKTTPLPEPNKLETSEDNEEEEGHGRIGDESGNEQPKDKKAALVELENIRMFSLDKNTLRVICTTETPGSFQICKAGEEDKKLNTAPLLLRELAGDGTLHTDNQTITIKNDDNNGGGIEKRHIIDCVLNEPMDIKTAFTLRVVAGGL